MAVCILFIYYISLCRQYYHGIFRPSHLKIPGGPRMARAALSRWAIDGPNVGKLT